jgi:hypothetical protein
MSTTALILLYGWSCLMQAGLAPGLGGSDCLSQADRARLVTESKLDNRIKVYDEASSRCERMINSLIQREEFMEAPAKLTTWTGLLEAALKDIDSAPGRKDKSKPLIRFEIHLRRSINAMQESKMKALAEHQDDFEKWIGGAESVRKKIVAMLFPG